MNSLANETVRKGELFSKWTIAENKQKLSTIYVRLSSGWPWHKFLSGRRQDVPMRARTKWMQHKSYEEEGKARHRGTNKNVIVFLSLPRILLCIHCQTWPQNLLRPCFGGAEQSVRMDIKNKQMKLIYWGKAGVREHVCEVREWEREDTWQSLSTTRSWSWTLLQITDPWIEQPSPIVTWFITTELTTCIQTGMHTLIIGQSTTEFKSIRDGIHLNKMQNPWI